MKEKVFLRACSLASQDPVDKLHVMVIDEFNRGDPSRIFGEALTYIERRNEPFSLPSSRKRVFVPENLILLATMNPFDKSISDLDQAIDRRFEKIEMPPRTSILRDILVGKNNMDPALAGKIIKLFEELNVAIKDRIGHAYFKDAKDLSSLRRVWHHKILPLLKKDLRYEDAKLAGLIKTFEEDFKV